MNRNQWKGNALLLIAAVIWGLAFVAQDTAAKFVEPFTLNGTRSLIGFAFLLPFCLMISKKKGVPLLEKPGNDRKNLIKAGIFCGAVLCVAVNFQQFGIALYPAEAAASGRSGFITALYVVLVPLAGLFRRQKLPVTTWLGVGLAVGGMYLLCFSSGLGNLYFGDLIVFFCALSFCGQILCIDLFRDAVDGVKLSCIEFLVCGVLSLILMFIFETPTWEGILSGLPYILYLGIMSSGVAYTFQILGQQLSGNPSVASLLMSLESVFAAIGGALILQERLSGREIVGCCIMFAAILLAQLPPPVRKKEV